MAGSWLVSVIFGEVPIHSFSTAASQIEEFLQKVVISFENRSESSFFQWKMTWFSHRSPHLLILFAVLSIHLLISVSRVHSSPCMLYLSLFRQSHNSLWDPLQMRVLSYSNSHYLNRHMAWCGCHEVLIQRCITVLCLENFSLYPIQLWFCWLSYSSHLFQLISIQ